MAHERPVPGVSTRRQFLRMGSLAAGGLALAACGGGQSAQQAAGGQQSGGQDFSATYDGPLVRLAFWNGFTGGDGPTMRSLVQQFSKEHQNIKATMNVIRWADYYQRLPAAVNSGKGPDVAIVHVEQLATQAARRVIVPLDDVAKSLQLQEDDFIPSIWNAGMYQEKRYGIPLDVHSLAMYYNTDQFSKAGVSDAPKDKAAFESALAAAKSKGGVAQPFWMPSLWPAHLMFLSLLWQNGGEPYNAEGTQATFNSDAGVQALTWMVDQVKNGNSPRNVAADAQYTAFKAGKVAVTWDGIWQINDLKTTASNLKWGIAPLPQIGAKPAVWANSHQFVLVRQQQPDQNKQQASKVFIDWISKKSREWAKSGMIPARNSERESQEFAQLKEQATVAQSIDDMHFLPQIPGIGDVQAQTLEIAVNEAVLQKKDPKQALDQWAAAASKVMEQNKKKFGG
jgi:multiple sugar transport system substrate-binding protein